MRRHNLIRIALFLFVSWSLLVFTPNLSKAESDRSKLKEFAEAVTNAIGKTVLFAAWPTATYKYSSFQDVDIVRDGIDITFRIYAQSSWTDKEIWLDVICTFDENLDLKRISWGDYKAFLPPGSAYRALKVLQEQ